MKLLTTFFFILITPLTIFLGTIVYGGISGTLLKEQLITTNVYANLDDFIQQAAPEEDESEEIVQIVKNRLTEEYIREKTETSIDDSFSYITGDTTSPPVLSLKEIQADIMQENPEIITEIEAMSDQMETMKVQATSDSGNSDEILVSSPEADLLTNLVKNDFSLPFGNKLDSLRQTLQILVYVVPIMAILALGSIIFLVMQNHTMQSRFRWLAIAFLGASIAGFCGVLGTTSSITLFMQLLQGNTNEIGTIFVPVIISLVTTVVDIYTKFQVMANYGFLLTGIICLVGMFAMKDAPTPLLKHAETKKK